MLISQLNPLFVDFAVNTLKESVSHIVSECKKLAQKDYKRKHDKVAKIVHWKLCTKYELESEDKWYEYALLGCVKSDRIKLLWDINVQCDHVIEARKPDIILVNKESKVCAIIDVAIPGDIRVCEKETEKVEKYQDLKREIVKIWKMKEVKVIPIVILALGCVLKSLVKWIQARYKNQDRIFTKKRLYLERQGF